MWELGKQSNWDLVLTNTYYANVSQSDPKIFVFIPSITVSVNSQILLIGARNPQAPSHWYLAGNAFPRLLFTPSFDSEFLSLVQSSPGVKVGLNRLTLLTFPDYDLLPYILEINIARWHKEMLLEIWQYNGSFLDVKHSIADIKSDLSRIETKIDASTI